MVQTLWISVLRVWHTLIFRCTDSDGFSDSTGCGIESALAREHLVAFRSAPDVLLWITEWGVWPSGERMHIFERFRLSYGVDSPLIKHPGHLLTQDEFETTWSLAIFAILFLWDCYVLASNKQVVLFYSHDEFGNITEKKVA